MQPFGADAIQQGTATVTTEVDRGVQLRFAPDAPSELRWRLQTGQPSELVAAAGKLIVRETTYGRDLATIRTLGGEPLGLGSGPSTTASAAEEEVTPEPPPSAGVDEDGTVYLDLPGQNLAGLVMEPAEQPIEPPCMPANEEPSISSNGPTVGEEPTSSAAAVLPTCFADVYAPFVSGVFPTRYSNARSTLWCQLKVRATYQQQHVELWFRNANGKAVLRRTKTCSNAAYTALECTAKSGCNGSAFREYANLTNSLVLALRKPYTRTSSKAVGSFLFCG
jgi:hypothetical protein